MFLRQFTNKFLVPATSTLSKNLCRNINGILGTYESELIDKWKQKFAEENVPEIDTSVEQILQHIIEKDKASFA